MEKMAYRVLMENNHNSNQNSINHEKKVREKKRYTPNKNGSQQKLFHYQVHPQNKQNNTFHHPLNLSQIQKVRFSASPTQLLESSFFSKDTQEKSQIKKARNSNFFNFPLDTSEQTRKFDDSFIKKPQQSLLQIKKKENRRTRKGVLKNRTYLKNMNITEGSDSVFFDSQCQLSKKKLQKMNTLQQTSNFVQRKTKEPIYLVDSFQLNNVRLINGKVPFEGSKNEGSVFESKIVDPPFHEKKQEKKKFNNTFDNSRISTSKKGMDYHPTTKQQDSKYSHCKISLKNREIMKIYSHQKKLSCERHLLKLMNAVSNLKVIASKQ